MITIARNHKSIHLIEDVSNNKNKGIECKEGVEQE